MKNTKGNGGITLIALVVTIIVLLILAGISIGMLSGQNGILVKSRDAKYNTIEATIKEKVRLAAYSAIAKNDGVLTETQDLRDELDKVFNENVYTITEVKETTTGWTVKVKHADYEDAVFENTVEKTLDDDVTTP